MKNNQIMLIMLTLVISALSWKVISASFINFFNPDIPAHLKAGQHYAVLDTIRLEER